MTGKFVLPCITLLLACALLAGCGKRPEDVLAPEGAEAGWYPHTYPDPTTDPAGADLKK